MLISYDNENFDSEKILETKVLGDTTINFLILFSEYDQNSGDYPVMGFGVRVFNSLTPDENGVSALFDSFIDARAYWEYATQRPKKS